MTGGSAPRPAVVSSHRLNLSTALLDAGLDRRAALAAGFIIGQVLS